MAPLPDSFKAYQFHTGIDRIRDAYRASVATMESSRVAAKDAYTRYEASGQDDSEYDEDGALVHSTFHALNYDEMNAGLAVIVVREAFITSAFHYWEVSARRWTGLHKSQDNFVSLSKASAARFPVSPMLEHLNTLNNFIKHRNPDRAASLVEKRGDYFAPLFPPRPGSNPASLRLRLLDEHVEEAFEIVKASGPR